MIAISKGNTEALKMLIKGKADLNAEAKVIVNGAGCE